MSVTTGIEWTDATWNPTRGCTPVSAGCKNCYASAVAKRFSGPGQPYEGLVRINAAGERTHDWNGEIRLVEEHLLDPLRWKKPRRIFVDSMSDLFHEGVPDAWIDKVFAVMALCPWHTFQVLTKRPERMLRYLRAMVNDTVMRIARNRVGAEAVRLYDVVKAKRLIDPRGEGAWPLPNVWLGISCEDQATADERIPLLLQTPAAARFISAEPLLRPIMLRGYVWLPRAVRSDLPFPPYLVAMLGMHEAHRNPLGAVSVRVDGQLLGVKPEKSGIMQIDEMMTVEMAAKIELDFLRWEARSRDTLDVKRCYVDVAGDLIAGLLLSQIVYWFLPSRHGESKLMVEKYGRRWLVKGREDWWEECRISIKQFDRAIEMLEKRGLVETRVSRFQGKPMKHVSVHFEALARALDDLPFLPKREELKLPFGEIHDSESTAETTSTKTPLPPSKSEGGCVEDSNAPGEATAHSDPGSACDACAPSDPAWTAEQLRSDLAQAVGVVMRGCGFVDARLAPVLRGVLGRSPPEGLRAQADAMIAAWAEYGDCVELLRFSWRPRKFFGQGHWERAHSWPVDQERLAQVRNSRLGMAPQ